MRFFPHTEHEIKSMLEEIGLNSIEDLIAHVPAELSARATIGLSPGLGEQAVAAEIGALAEMNQGTAGWTSFLGGGYYRHYIPAVVRAIISRPEFATAYTPYQAEASQGTLQAIFEFQTLMAELTGLEVANASMYDGASAAAEAVLMAHRLLPKRSVVAMARSLWPDYQCAIRTYLSALDNTRIVELPYDSASGTIDLKELKRIAGPELLCVVNGYPNFFGVVEPLARISEIARTTGALCISVTAEPLALGLIKAPGALGADIAVGEGQSFGLPLQFGGPGLGFMAARMTHVRQMPGRLVGQTVDRNGRRCFCLTLSTREQHIRRERATSNICTNHSLCALAATVYLSILGRRGLRRLAAHNVQLAHQASNQLAAAGLRPRFSAPFFNEFVVQTAEPEAVLKTAERRRILAGIRLDRDYPELSGCMLIAITETNQPADFTKLCEALAENA